MRETAERALDSSNPVHHRLRIRRPVRLGPISLSVSLTLEGHSSLVAALGAALLLAAALAAIDPDSETSLYILAYTLGAGAPLTGIIFMEGVVSRDLETGVALLWLQKPVRPWVYYLERFIESLLGALLVVLAFSAAAAAIVVARNPDVADRALSVIALFLLATLLSGCVTFGFSGLGLRRDWGATIVFFLGALTPFALHVLDPERTASWWRWARTLLPPYEAWLTLSSYFVGKTAPGAPGALAWYLGYCAAWVALGALATAWATRSPFTRGDTH